MMIDAMRAVAGALLLLQRIEERRAWSVEFQSERERSKMNVERVEQDNVIGEAATRQRVMLLRMCKGQASALAMRGDVERSAGVLVDALVEDARNLDGSLRAAVTRIGELEKNVEEQRAMRLAAGRGKKKSRR